MQLSRPTICLASLMLFLQPLTAHADLTVKIGQVSPLTGELSHIGKDDENGVRLAIEDLNNRKVRNPKLTQQGFTNVFRMVANDVRQGSVIGAYLVHDLGAHKVAIVDDRTAYGQGLADEIEKSVKAAGGNVVAREFGTDKTTNWMAILTTIKSRQPEGIAFTGGDTQAAAFVQQAQKLGLKVKFIAGDEACTPQFIKLAGSSMNNDTYCTLAGVPPAKMPQGPEFFKRYQQRFGVPVQLYAPYAYDAVLAMADAMQAAGSTDPKVYLPKLRASKLDGVTGAIQFDEKGDIRNGAITVRQFDQGNWTDRSVVR
ncbi:branched-chain amino acid ABC transporter substrate-binding protein [Paraburkholderia diazotrophica]|uniref:branched-chain amino acid ABC transporter substrate-binding protein n=1 Tax=Paraburkholderia diazotrophica TaxID=667676 RepID=UPI003181529B